MERGLNKIVIVTRKTRLSGLVKRYNTVEQARFYVEHMGIDFDDYVIEDSQYTAALEELKAIAAKYGIVQVIDREFLPNMIFGPRDVVIAIGQDGLVANVMKYLDREQPLIGVNPDTGRYDGVLLPFETGRMDTVIPNVLNGNYSVKTVTLAKAETNDGQSLLAVNDFFVGNKSHVSARYKLFYGGESETQMSSGIIISTGMGASGWYKSVIAEYNAISRYFGGKTVPIEQRAWDEEYLTFAVREPFPSKTSGCSLVFGKIGEGRKFDIESNMSANGVIFSDGMEEDAIEFNSGMKVSVTLADTKGKLVV